MLIASNAQGYIWDGPEDSYYKKPVVAWDWVTAYGAGCGVVAKGTISGHGMSQNIMYFQDFATARNAFPIRFDPLYH